MANDITSDNLGDKILEAAKTTFGEKFSVIKTYLTEETRKLADTLDMIIEGRAKSEISEEEAKILLNNQKIAASSVLVAASGMTDAAVQSAINAALGVVKEFVNGKVGFPLLN